MRKKFLLTAAIMATASFVGTTIAQAVSVEWGGRLRPRMEYAEQFGFNDPGVENRKGRDGDFFISSMIRLDAKVDILPDTSAFIQLQSVRNWGNDLGNLPGNVPQGLGAGPGGGGSSGGSGNAAFSPSDNDQSVGVHQAYFTLKNFATLPIDLKFGRQEVILDGHRLFGNTVWTQGMQSHDAITVSHKAGNTSIAYVYSLANEGPRSLAGPAAGDNQDVEAHVLYTNTQGILGGALSLYFVGIDDEITGQGSIALPIDNDFYTVGFRQAGQLFGIDYRAEFYYQFGQAEGDATRANGVLTGGTPYGGTAGLTGNLKGTSRSAYMFGARIGKKFNNVMWKPSFTLWYDYLSGTSDADARNGNFKTFNTLFDTGHKFYGLMDVFLPAAGDATRFLGLVDYSVQSTLQPAKDWKLSTQWHYFTTAEGMSANTAFSGAPGGSSNGNDLGTELDFTLIHKYNAHTTISAGYSKYWQTQGFELVNTRARAVGGNPSPADWAYLMFDVQF